MEQKKKKKATSTQVAELAGVSQASVSLILNGNTKIGFSDQTKARVFAAAKELGYQPPHHKKPAQAKNRLIMVMIPTIINQYYSELVQTLEHYADSIGCRILLCNTFRRSELELYYLEQFAGSKICGIIYTFLPGAPNEVAALSARLPVVLIGEKTQNSPICSIELSNESSGALMAKHLFELGHRNIAYITTPMNHLTLARRQRLNGLQNWLREQSNLTGEPVNVFIIEAKEKEELDPSFDNTPYDYYIGKNGVDELLETHPEVTAIIGACDMVSVGILSELQARGVRVPEAYSVCGFDNIFTGSILSPALTTIDHRLRARAKSAVDLILEQNAYFDAAQKQTMLADKIAYLPQLIVRGSTGPARAENP